MLGLIVLAVAIIFAIYTLKKEYFQSGPPNVLDMIPRSMVRFLHAVKDIPNAEQRAKAIFDNLEAKKITIKDAIDNLYVIFMEGEAAYKADIAKSYASIFTDALDDLLKMGASQVGKSMTADELAQAQQAVAAFKAKIASQTAAAAGAPASVAASTLLGAALAAPAGVGSAAPVVASASAAKAVPSEPATTKDMYSQMRPALIDDIRSAVKTEIAASGIRQNADTLRERTRRTVDLDTVGTNQGIDYDNMSTKGPVCQGDAEASCPPEHNGCENGDMNDSCPAPIDMNKYIRKDSIPCWGCTLPTDY
jgi:hypothetical protein